MSNLRIHYPPAGEWHLSRHITSPDQQGSCIGLPRKNGPLPMPSHYEEPRKLPDPANWNPARNAVKRNVDTGLYGVRDAGYGRYRVTFTYQRRAHHGGVYDDWREAGQAHDDYVLEHGMDRPLNFPLEHEASA